MVKQNVIGKPKRNPGPAERAIVSAGKNLF
jgi:hypothetical protein